MTSNHISAKAKERIIVPLDFTSDKDAIRVARKLNPHVGMFKIGLTLYMSAGKTIIHDIQKEVGGDKVFLDIKFADIPHTVGGVSSVVVSKTEVKFFTVHAQLGGRILRAAVEAMQNGTKVLAVTVLTSESEKESQDLGYSLPIARRVLKYAEMAQEAGCSGIVCSGLEARAVKEKCGSDFIVVTPGIRPASMPVTEDDQRRIMTPGEAIKNGSDYLVIGRPIYRSNDMVGAANQIAEEIQEVIEQSS